MLEAYSEYASNMAAWFYAQLNDFTPTYVYTEGPKA